MEVTRDHLLIRFMYYICNGSNVGGNFDLQTLTPLEKALDALSSLNPLCTDSIAELADTVTFLIKQQVVFSLIFYVSAVKHFSERTFFERDYHERFSDCL